MANSSNLVSYEVAAARIGVLPTLAPRPNGRNLRTLVKALTEALQGIPSYQSQRYGFMGFVVPPEEYVLTGEQPWVDYADPGYHRALGGTASAQRDADTQYNVAKNIFLCQENVRQAINKALTAAVPEAYRRGGGDIGPPVYTPTDDPRAILDGLHSRYGTLTPAEKEHASLAWNLAWNPANPIETMFFHLEELFVQAVRAGVPYSSVQLLDKGLDNVKKTGIFITAIVEWNGFVDADKSWNNFKAHFAEAFAARLDSGPTAATAGYHGAAMALAEDDDSSLGSLAGSLAQMQMANNANTQALHESISGISTGTTELRQALLATQQQVAALARAVHARDAPNMPAWTGPPPSPAAYAAAVQQPYAVPPPPTVNTGYAYAATPGVPPPPPLPFIALPGFSGGRGRGRGGRGRGQRGRGRNRSGGAGFQPNPPAYYQQGQHYGGVPPPAGGGGGRGGFRANPPNEYKRWNNWNACYSCGFDVPGWHTSATCPGPRKDGHHDGYDRKNSKEYIDAGHAPSTRASHKKYLPIPGTQAGE